MKSFFKKIALVLVLAMVVTMLPAKTASAKTANGVVMRTKMNLYVEGSDAATGNWKDSGFAWVKNQDGTGKVSDIFNVSFVSDNPEVATVREKTGFVKAVGVGKAIITATFTPKDGGEAFKLECTVNVKKNATAIRISEYREEQFAEGINVGFTLPYLTVWREDADGVGGWNKKSSGITDGIRFESDNEEVLSVDFETGELKALKEGEATLTMYAIQSEGAIKTEDGETVYLKTGASATYPVKVVAGKPVITDVKAISVSKLELTVTGVTNENKDTLKVFSGEGEAKGEITQLFAPSVLNDEKTTLTLTKYNNFTDNESLVLKFGDDGEEVEYVVKVGAPDKIIVTGPDTVVVGADPVAIEYQVVDANGLDLEVAYNSGKVSFDITGGNWSVTSANGTIAMYEEGVTVNVKATYHTGDLDPNKNYEEITFPSNEFVIRCVPKTAIVATGMDFALDTYDNSKFGTTVSMYEDQTAKLSVRVNLNAGEPITNKDSDYGFTFETLAPSVILVDATTGKLQPISVGQGSILVKYLDDNGVSRTGVVVVKVLGKRVETTISAEVSAAFISNAKDVDEKATVTLKAKDQYDQNFNDPSIKKLESVSRPNGVSEDRAKELVNVDGNKIILAGKDVADNEVGTYIYRATSGTDKVVVFNITIRKPQTTIANYKVLLDNGNLEIDPKTVKDEDFAKYSFRVVAVDTYGVAINVVDNAEVKIGDIDAKYEGGKYNVDFITSTAKGTETATGSAEVITAGSESIIVKMGNLYGNYNVALGTFNVTGKVKGTDGQERNIIPTTVTVSIKADTPSCSVNSAVVEVKAGQTYKEAILEQIKIGNGDSKYMPYLADADIVTAMTETSKGTSYVFVRNVKVYEKVTADGVETYVLHNIALNRYFSVTQ